MALVRIPPIAAALAAAVVLTGSAPAGAAWAQNSGPGSASSAPRPAMRPQPVRQRPTPPGAEVPVVAGPGNGFTVAQLRYGGGGDWYADETSIQNLLAALKERTGIQVAAEERVVVSATEERLFNHPFLFLTGHGNIKFTPVEVERLRAYLLGGGFLWADDDYGMDASFRREMRRILPEDSLVELPFDHEVYRSFYKLEGGIPKIHEHDNQPPRALGVYHDGRLVCFYSYETDIGDGIEAEEMHHDPPEKREEAVKMAINIVMYALTH